MEYALFTSKHAQCVVCTCPQDFARFLIEKVQLEGRLVKAHGGLHCYPLQDDNLENPEEPPYYDLIWMLADEGLLLFRGSLALNANFERRPRKLIWIPDLRCEDPFAVQQFFQGISLAHEGRITESRENRDTKQEIGLRVNRIVYLQKDLSLHAFPLEEIPEKDLLASYSSEQLFSLGLFFAKEGYTGYLDLVDFDLFVQGPDWRYSRHRCFKKEPRLATKSYSYLLLIASKDISKPLISDGSEQRECLFLNMLAHNGTAAVEHLMAMTMKTGSSRYELQFNPRQEIEPKLEIWRVILAQDSWESLFEILCKPDYENHTLRSTWLCFFNYFHRANYTLMKETLKYLLDWVEQAMDTAEGVSAYSIY
jgi:hypothetical protein